jgi:hypothetical protein
MKIILYAGQKRLIMVNFLDPGFELKKLRIHANPDPQHCMKYKQMYVH